MFTNVGHLQIIEANKNIVKQNIVTSQKKLKTQQNGIFNK